MMTYTVYIQETFTGYVAIEASSAQEAEDIAREQVCSGSINPTADFDGDTFVEAEKA